ncbi:MAG TPA: hypothetical protein PLE27_04015 [Bacteroidia bacterium]|nr:hypothetical protein [Bacteroidia bacterium]HRB85759.1 hypothetical protein [Bacteroidia bacterium]
MAALTNIYTKVIETLRVGGLPFSCYDIDMGQMESEGIELPLQYPAILIKLGDVVWRDFSDDVQIGTVTLSVKVIFQFQKEDEMIAQSGPRNEVIENLEMLENINTIIAGITGDSFNKFRRFNQYHPETKSKELLWIHVLQYQCNIMSNGDAPDPALDLDVDNLKNNNSFLERRKYSLVNK